jgi:exopolysaccharide production protein ExoZ
MTTERGRKFLSIQALRMVAALLVVVTHSTQFALERLDRHFFIWERGTRGVDIFFVISGFVMVFSSQKLFAQADGWRTFAEHRIVRIVPLYWLVTSLKVMILLVTPALALHAKLTPITAICSYLFLPSRNLDGKLWPLVSVGWTLNFEMLFYFLFTVALFWRRSVYRFIGVILTMLAVAALFRQPAWPAAAFYLDSMVLEFFFGMLVARACLRGLLIPQRVACFLLPIGFLLLLLPSTELHVPKVLLSGVPASLIIWSAASLGSLERFIPSSVLFLGDASYSIYLIHTFVCPLAPSVFSRIHWIHPWLSVCISVAIGVGAGCVLHKFVELPMTGWLKSRVRARQSLRPVESTA